MNERDPKGWIQTYTGRKFWPLDPRPEEIDIEDIAHALSQICRFTGHTKFHYSVGQHSVLVSQIVPPQFALEGLLHDAAEAYMCDVARPVKQALKHVLGPIEERLERCIAERFGLVYPWPSEIKIADNILLETERRDVMFASRPWKYEDAKPTPMDETIGRWSTNSTKAIFLNAFERLMKERRKEAVA